jgi:hypothetical protein
MAVTLTQIKRNVPGDSFETVTQVAGDASYPTGGYPITPQALGYASHIRRIVGYDPLNFASAAVNAVFTPTYNGGTIASIKFQLQVLATGAEVAATTNVSAYTFVLTTEGV